MTTTTSPDTIVVFDTETTDTDPAAGAEVCEFGYVNLAAPDTGDSEEDRAWTAAGGAWSYVETAAPFSPAARGVHHIAPERCAPGAPDCVPREWAARMIRLKFSPTTWWAAHNAPFDLAFLPELGEQTVIDTLRCAQHLYPDAPNHRNQTLRYYLDAEPDPELVAGLDAHRTQYDSAVTAAILAVMLRDHSPQELLELSRTPVLQRVVRFGKYRGYEWGAVPADYLRFLARGDMYRDDDSIRRTVDHHLSRGRLI